jgi:hypothetical protein
MSRKRFSTGVVLVFALAAMVGGGAVSAADGLDAGGQGLFEGSRTRCIAGTWQATVSRGPVLPPVTSLHTFSRDRTMIESGSDSAFRSPGYGGWKYLGDRIYATTLVFHRFNAAGEHIGSVKVKANRRLSADCESYVGVGINEVRDLNGNVIVVGRATVTGRRMHVEEIPDLP